jgi:hypothetical protein
MQFGTVKASSVICASNTDFTVVAPPHAAGTVDVKATVNKLASSTVSADTCTYG